ncbi:MAG: helix-hairpin-helix domain-containing protein [Oscillospiraceae bacterium]|nr:helix-hairpin-helix domain-containing protein [Oscillospiraceae bacterium]
MQTDLTKIPYIGKVGAQDLINAGYPDIASLKGQDPEEVYIRDCLYKGYKDTKLALYVYRLAVAYADNDGVLPPDKLHWWNWK